jgi:hypothetical protein
MAHKSVKRLILVFALLAALLLTGCNASGNAGTSLLPSGSARAEAVISEEDTQTTWEDACATHITFGSNEAEIEGTGASFADGTLAISEAGTYVLSGTLDDGQILIDAAKTDTIHLVFIGISIVSGKDAVLYEKKAGKVILTLAEGSENSLTSAAGTIASEEETEPDAALYCQNSLTINGPGGLTVTGNYNHGIVSKDDLIITGGTLFVTAAGTGIRGRDSLTVTNGDITVNAQGDALQSNNEEDSTKGTVTISGGTFHLTAIKDGIQAESALNISGGSFTIQSGSDTESSAADTAIAEQAAAVPDTAITQESETVSSATMMKPGQDGFSQGGGPDGFPPDGGRGIPGNTQKVSVEGGKGLKATKNLTITGGTFDIVSADDAIHVNGDALIEDGIFTIVAGDDGVHADGTVTIKGGTLTIEKSYEGLEAATILLEGGTVNIVASDDGLNAAGGNDGSALEGLNGQNEFEAGDYVIRISGGTVTVNAGGDGVDSNGSIYLSGGTVLVDGPISNGNGAIDYNGVFEVTGGTLAASGSSGMAQGPSSSSNQASLMVYQSGSGAIALLDSNGNTVATHSPAKAFQTVLFSTPQMKKGETYTLTIDGQTIARITLSEDITTYSADGTQGGLFDRQFPGGGGQGGPGGGRRIP